jgi:chromosomal replication initiator protein
MSVGIWNEVLEELKVSLDADSFKHWFGVVEAEERKNTLMLWVPSLFHKDWIEKHYRHIITECASKHNGGPVAVRVLQKTEGGSTRPRAIEPSGRVPRAASRLRQARIGGRSSDFLNPLYTFDSFVVGTSNQFAHAACLAVAEAPSKIYNPLFIYGGVGLGKTHLMQAIGHQVLRNRPDARLLYASAEQFTNEFINSIRDNKIDAFHRKYRQVELLLMDDIQFLANKDRSQEEFFHTFNELYESNCQLVIASDRTPREIPTVEDRLRSRLEWGLITDIQPPNPETRIAILRKKAEESDIDIPNECIEYIAARVRSNIRELEGALMRVSALAAFSNRRIDLLQTQEALRDLMETHRDARVSVDQIQKAVSEYFKVTPGDLKSKRRTSDITLPRQIAMFLCRDITGLSLPVIGTEFGGRDHTTVLHSCKKISGLLERDRHMQNMLNDIKGCLRG